MSDSEAEHSEAEEASEAELALKKRKDAQRQVSSGLDEAAKELLENNRQDRLRMEQEIQELRERNEKRKKQREQEEKRLAAERAAEEERRKAAEEDKRRKKDEEDQKKQRERAQKMAEFEKWKNPTGRNFVISRKSEAGDEEEEGNEAREGGRKSKEQLEAEKKAILKQRIQTLEIAGFDAAKLADKARELHKLIYRLEGEKYDLEKRFKLQQVDMMELAERARQANKVGKGGLKRIQATSDDVDKIQERFAGTPAKIEMYSKYERQKDKRPYSERKNQYTGPQFLYPPDRIPPTKIIKWNEEGQPIYGTLGEGGSTKHEEAAAEAEA